MFHGSLMSALKDLTYVSLLGSSPLFMSWAYARAYMGSPNWARFASLHYILIGERRGYFPNAFYDPFFVKSQDATCSFARYIFNKRYANIVPSPHFDPFWYDDVHSEVSSSSNPFVRFWEGGFDEDKNPSPLFDLRFFKLAVCRDRPDKRIAAFDKLRNRQATFPKNIDELRLRQAEFYGKVKLKVLQASSQRRSNYLLFIQASSSFDAKLFSGNENFDLWINYYDEKPRETLWGDIATEQTGTKTTAIRKILEEMPDLLLRYEAVMFMDDDVCIAADKVAQLFRTVATEGLDLAQASLTANSACYYDILKQPQAGDGIQLLTAVEIMMPVVSRRVLQTCGWVFQEAISGWSIDLLLSREVRRRFGNSIALIGSIVAEHLRPTDLNEGAFYAFLASNGIDPTTEAGAIIMRYGANESWELRKLDTRQTPDGRVEPMRQEQI